MKSCSFFSFPARDVDQNAKTFSTIYKSFSQQSSSAHKSMFIKKLENILPSQKIVFVRLLPSSSSQVHDFVLIACIHVWPG